MEHDDDGGTSTTKFVGSGTLEYYRFEHIDRAQPAHLSANSIGDLTPAQISAPLPAFADPGVSGFGFIRPANGDIQLALLARADVTVEAYKDGGFRDSFKLPVEVPIFLPEFNDGQMSTQFPYIRLSLDNSFHANGGTSRARDQDWVFELTWQQILAEYGLNPGHEK